MEVSISSASIPPNSVPCVLCEELVIKCRAVTGLRYADGRQAFACRAHLNDGSLTLWVLGWQEFQAAQVAIDEASDATIYIEQRRVQRQPDIARTLVRHLSLRLNLGTALIVTENPRSVAQTLRKPWLELLRAYKRQQAATLKPTLRTGFAAAIQHLEHVVFLPEQPARSPQNLPASVYLVNSAVLRTLPWRCSTVYVLSPVNGARLRKAIRQLAPGGTVVSYVPLADYLDEQQIDAELRTIS